MNREVRHIENFQGFGDIGIGLLTVGGYQIDTVTLGAVTCVNVARGTVDTLATSVKVNGEVSTYS